jgi:hypothetical protein
MKWVRRRGPSDRAFDGRRNDVVVVVVVSSPLFAPLAPKDVCDPSCRQPEHTQILKCPETLPALWETDPPP